MNFLKANRVFLYVLGGIAFFSLLYFFFLSPPRQFPAGSIFRVSEGMGLRSISFRLKQENMIRSRLAFEAFAILYGGEKKLIATDYYFENTLPVFEIAKRISKGEHHMAPVVVTIPEGFDAAQIADAFAPRLANFSKVRFLSDAQGLEGRLFPDTYFFLTTDDETSVISAMSKNFNAKTALIRPDLAKSLKMDGRTEEEIITMASVIEREAKGDSDRGIISGILWRRLSIGMPLQVDSAPDTYKTKGLPKNPIGNPGMEAIQAAIHPDTTSYLYYLHDKDGNIHYAKTFKEHTANVAKYLK